MLPYISIILMLVGIIATFITFKRPRRVVIWSIVTVIILQSLSFLLFSGIVQKSVAFLWIGAGFGIGMIFGAFIKLNRNGKYIFYKQNIIFAVSYLALLLINQLIALLFKSYIPAMLFIAAVAVGMQVGFNLVIVLKTKKLRKAYAIIILLCCSFLFSTFALPAKAADNKISKLEGDWEMVYMVDVNNVSESQKNKLLETLADKWSIRTITNRLTLNSLDVTSNINPTNGNIEFEYNYQDYKYKFITGISDDGNSMAGYFYINKWDDTNTTYVSGRIVARNTGKQQKQSKDGKPSENSLDGLWKSELIVTKWGVSKETLPQFANGSSSESFKIENGKLIQYGSFKNSKMTVEGNRITIENYQYNATSTIRLTYSGQISNDMEHIDGNFSWQIKAAEQIQYDTWLEAKWIAVKVQALGNHSTGEDNQAESNLYKENPFIPKPISSEDANTAATASGFLAGLSALISTIASLVGGAKDLAGMPLPDTQIPYPADPQNIIINPKNPDISHVPQPSNPDAPMEPPLGTRRGDGKIYTLNHGWQNESYPEMNINSIKNIISSLENDIQRHVQNGDKLRAEIARDELKRNLRELKYWQEDSIAIKRAQTGESEDFYQNQAKRWANRADDLETAENVANTISFASDIALAIGTSGISTTLTSAKTTLESLSLAKEISGALAEGYMKDKNMGGVITKFGVNKGISMGVGKIFDAGKGKYGVENAKNALKALVAAAETSSGNIAQNIAEEAGLTGKIVGAVDAADNHFKGVAQSLNDIAKGGE